MKAFVKTVRFVLSHPLNRDRPAAALARWLRWQLGNRLLPGPVLVPFVDEVGLLVRPGMVGATGNVYCGLHEPEDMALVLHALRPDDLFVDIGANIGSYTLLAGATGARVMAVEPIPATFRWLQRNIAVNDLSGRVRALNLGLGRAAGQLRFTGAVDAVKHVAAAGEETAADLEEVAVESLDTVLAGEVPALIKLDVEGYETEVLAGAEHTLAAPGLLAVVMELNGSGARYGFDDAALHQQMLALGFTACRYAPVERQLEPLAEAPNRTGNTLYVRDLEAVRERVRTAARFRLGTGVEL
ncbi:FkbM family methyltransferase [Lamprobacter modestohalophilus]|uniref:FkbM family methyltransferase n=1 Tax=Lamprobacter modestohalophilus TaxID=1064514 RepID=UPI002ADEAA88|nr:FkbM family methyltransferase [Lamprobacter modestohalophilus]MEA1049021.1 FkbM family methyltransferase [Lamprobacter modestohalophilus]